MSKKTRSLKTVQINSLIPYARNTKKHPEQQIDKLVSSIHAYGFNVPLVIDKENVVIAGHGRLEAAKRLGLTEVPVIIADDLSEEEVMAYRIADNKTAESEWDNDFLKFELGTLDRLGFDLKLTGFEEDELLKINGDLRAISELPDEISDAAKAHTAMTFFIEKKDVEFVNRIINKKASEIDCEFSRGKALVEILGNYED